MPTSGNQQQVREDGEEQQQKQKARRQSVRQLTVVWAGTQAKRERVPEKNTAEKC